MDGLNLPIGEIDGRSGRFGSRRLAPQKPSVAQRALRRLPFLLVVIVPTIISGIYYFGVASYQYVSEANFVVRGPATGQPSLISSLLQGSGSSHSQDDTFSVQNYILSRDALSELVNSANFRSLMSHSGIDPLSRFPLPFSSDTFEALYKYYLRHVDVVYDSNTGISQLTVNAFSAADAKKIAVFLFGSAERLINRMNDRQRENTLRDARSEVKLVEQRVQDVAAKIAAFRNRETLLDPDRQSVAMLQGVTDLQSRLTQTRTQIAELTKSSPNSPLIITAQRRAAALQTQIVDQTAKVAGSDQSLVPKITEYDRLVLDRDFADRELVSATTSLETARVNATRQQLYLDEIVQPNEADYPAYPKRFAGVAVVFAICLALYFMGKLLVVGAREHRLA